MLLLKQIFIIIFIILAILSIYFGSYLPLVKARRYVAALRSNQNVKTLEDFKANFDKSFTFYSPIGDEEIAKFLSSDILTIIASQNQQEKIDRALVDYLEPYAFKNNVRHLMVMGQMHGVIWEKYGRKEEDFQKAEEYWQKAFVIGPKLPPVLYGMLNLYQAKGDQEKIKEISEIIIQYWPEDEKIKLLLSELKK